MSIDRSFFKRKATFENDPLLSLVEVFRFLETKDAVFLVK